MARFAVDPGLSTLYHKSCMKDLYSSRDNLMLGTNIHPDCRGLSVYARIVPLGRGGWMPLGCTTQRCALTLLLTHTTDKESYARRAR